MFVTKALHLHLEMSKKTDIRHISTTFNTSIINTKGTLVTIWFTVYTIYLICLFYLVLTLLFQI